MERKGEPFDSVMGINCLYELLRHAPERIVKVLALKGEVPSGRKADLIQLIKEKKIDMQWANKELLFSYTESDSHQGFVALIKKRNYSDLFSFCQKLPEKALILAVDQIYDPQNFGALLRSAECFGVSGVLWSKNRGTAITAVVSKASSGASEIIPLLRVSNLATTLLELQKKGFSLLAADADAKAQNLLEFSFPERSVLIMGSEGEGIQPLIRKMCDHILAIPMYGKICSLNVAQAASVCLSHWRKDLEILS